MVHYPKFTSENRQKFLVLLSEGNTVKNAAKQCSMSREAFYHHRENDPVFAKEWDEAMAESIAHFEQELKRRAVDGVEEAIYHQGQIVGYQQKFSDTLLIFLLKARKPEVYRERSDIRLEATVHADVDPATIAAVLDYAARHRTDAGED